MNDNVPERILVVDSHSPSRDVVRRTLARGGYETVVEADGAGSARGALRQEGPFALVLMDLNLRDENGLGLLRELAPLAPHTIVVVVTVVQELNTALEAFKQGACDYLLKPFDAEVLLLAVGKALSQRVHQTVPLPFDDEPFVLPGPQEAPLSPGGVRHQGGAAEAVAFPESPEAFAFLLPETGVFHA